MNECQRILQVVTIMNRGGIENMLMSLYRNIDRNKIQFDFIVHRREKGDFDDEILALGGKIHYAPPYIFSNHYSYKKWWYDFFKTHNEYKIIHSHAYSIASIHLNIAKKYNLTTIVHSHSSSTGNGIKGKLKKLLQLNIENIPDYLFTCSDKAGEWLYGKDCKARSNYFLLKNAIPTDKYTFNKDIRHKVRKAFNIEDKYVIGHVGSFGLPKNHKYLIEIFKKISETKPNAVLLLIGDGNLRPEIENQIRELEILDKVIMTGIRTDVNEMLQAMDCFVFPSIYEGLPVTVIEAQAAGLPCFISDNITKEVVITDLVKCLPINVEPDLWAEEILKSETPYGNDTKEQIIKSGYDIDTTTEWLSDFYKNNEIR